MKRVSSVDEELRIRCTNDALRWHGTDPIVEDGAGLPERWRRLRYATTTTSVELVGKFVTAVLAGAALVPTVQMAGRCNHGGGIVQ